MTTYFNELPQLTQQVVIGRLQRRYAEGVYPQAIVDGANAAIEWIKTADVQKMRLSEDPQSTRTWEFIDDMELNPGDVDYPAFLLEQELGAEVAEALGYDGGSVPATRDNITFERGFALAVSWAIGYLDEQMEQ